MPTVMGHCFCTPHQAIALSQCLHKQSLTVCAFIRISLYYYYYYYTLCLPTSDKVRLQTSCSQGLPHILPLVGFARSKRGPINRGHGAQYFYRPPPAGAIPLYVCSLLVTQMRLGDEDIQTIMSQTLSTDTPSIPGRWHRISPAR